MNFWAIHYIDRDWIVTKKIEPSEIRDFLAPSDNAQDEDRESLSEAIRILTQWSRQWIHSIIGLDVKWEELILEQVTREYTLGQKVYSLQ